MREGRGAWDEKPIRAKKVSRGGNRLEGSEEGDET
jgi:hypothetical protein